jgi:hypothetical protein
MRASTADTDRLGTDGAPRCHGIGRPSCAIGAALATATSLLLLSSGASAQDVQHPFAEFGASVGWVQRSAVDDALHNPSNVRYQAALAETVQFKVGLWSWLRLGAYYQRAYHKVEIPTSSLKPPGTEIDLGDMLAYSIGTRIEPTFTVTPRLRLWGILGAGWGRMTVSKMKVTTPTSKYTVQDREGVFVEFPLGIGGAFNVIPGWLAITFDTTLAPNWAQSGSLHEPTQFVDAAGQMRHTDPLPELNYTFAQMFGLALLL